MMLKKGLVILKKIKKKIIQINFLVVLCIVIPVLEIFTLNLLSFYNIIYAPKYALWFNDYKSQLLLLILILIKLFLVLKPLLKNNKRKISEYNSFILGSFIGITIFFINYTGFFGEVFSKISTFNEANFKFVDLRGISSNCLTIILNNNQIECNYYDSEIPYGASTYLLGIIIHLVGTNFIAFLLHILSYSLLTAYVNKKLGINWVPIFILNPFMYFANERANIDLLFFILILINLILKDIDNKIKKILILFEYYLYSIKPNYLGYIFSSRKNIISKLIVAIVLILFSYNFSFSRLLNIQQTFNPVDFGAYGFKLMVNFIIENNVFIACFTCLITIIFVYLLYSNLTKKKLSIYKQLLDKNYIRILFLNTLIVVSGISVNYKLILLLPLIILILTFLIENQIDPYLAAPIVLFLASGELFLIRNLTIIFILIIGFSFVVGKYLVKWKLLQN